jgi:hypothetical protein
MKIKAVLLPNLLNALFCNQTLLYLFSQKHKQKKYIYIYIYIYIKFREKYKISSRGLLDLQFTPCGIKTNSKVHVVCKKNNLVHTIKFHQLT